jgi:hypothetical protein
LPATRARLAESLATAMNAAGCVLLAMALAVATGGSHGQSFHYVEPGVAACPAAAVPGAAASAPKPVPRGVPVSGRISVSCGFDQGSYTVSLSSTDPAATFAPKTFLVNFGRVVGNGAFSVTFSTPGLQSVSATVTSNMGSPAVRGQFVSLDNEYQVLPR